MTRPLGRARVDSMRWPSIWSMARLELPTRNRGERKLSLGSARVLSHGSAWAFAEARPLVGARAGDPREGAWPEHARTGASLNNLALAFSRSKGPRGSPPLLERALAISEKTLGADHPSTGDEP